MIQKLKYFFTVFILCFCYVALLGQQHKMDSLRLGNFGNIYYDQGNYSEALKNNFTSLKIKEEIGDKQGTAYSYNNLARVYIKQKKHAEAKKFATKALLIFKEAGHKVGIKDSYSALEEIEKLLGNYKIAFENQKLYIIYRDSLLNEENTKKTVQAQMQYEFDKKEDLAKVAQNKKNAVDTAEKNKRSVILYSVIGGMIIVACLLLVVFNALLIARKQKKVIDLQKKIVEEHHKEILDSIHYAKRIQTALLPTEKYIARHLARYGE